MWDSESFSGVMSRLWRRIKQKALSNEDGENNRLQGNAQETHTFTDEIQPRAEAVIIDSPSMLQPETHVKTIYKQPNLR